MYEKDSIIKRGMEESKLHSDLVEKALKAKARMSKEQLEYCQEEIILKTLSNVESEVGGFLMTAKQTELFDNGIDDIKATIQRLLKKFELSDDEKFLKEFSKELFKLCKIIIENSSFTL